MKAKILACREVKKQKSIGATIKT
ncbi:unknown protein [Parachlamydia acanthamoebae UV-7]|uniref:Uncharacterized protein n=1 Tax=Parachlamydia acanthamoebae (strain UV7) TaxID=765952 RepID=F8KVN9_PARAV|nr:unknown protein [Parachlamydia acanthamoebae UV-7]